MPTLIRKPPIQDYEYVYILATGADDKINDRNSMLGTVSHMHAVVQHTEHGGYSVLVLAQLGAMWVYM